MDLTYGTEGRRPEGQGDGLSRGLAAFASVMAFGRELTVSWEAAALMRAPVFLGMGVPKGKGEKVLLIPGVMAGDVSLAVLGDWLHRIGYKPMISHITFNVGCPSATMERLAEEIRAGGEKVSVLGHSKGGLVALMLAQVYPDLVNQVITMGAPVADPFDVRVATRAAIYGIGKWRRAHKEPGCCDYCYTPQCTCVGIKELRTKLKRPFTAFYSRRDGVVNWKACLRPGAHNMQVDASHVGMVYNPIVYSGIAQLLAQGAQGKQ